jgi:hypothetical protein
VPHHGQKVDLGDTGGARAGLIAPDDTPDALTNLDPGMGVRFVGLRPAQRRRLLELIRRIAYID